MRRRRKVTAQDALNWSPEQIRALLRQAFSAPAPKHLRLWNEATSRPGRDVRFK